MATDQAATPDKPAELPPLRSVHSSNFPAILDELGISLLVSTYQAGKLVLLRADNGVLNTHFRGFNRPMGLAVSGDRLAIGTGLEIWEYHNLPAVAARLEPAGRHDGCFMPRSGHVTGDIQIHEMAWAQPRSQESGVRGQGSEFKGQGAAGKSRGADGSFTLAPDSCSPTPDSCSLTPELWFVNTRFSCLCTLDSVHSFVPRWRPPFITALAPEDRCHLNGLAMAQRRARFRHGTGRNGHEGRLAGKQEGRRRAYRSGNGHNADARLIDAAFAALAQRPALAARIGYWRIGLHRSDNASLRESRRDAGVHPRPRFLRPAGFRGAFPGARDRGLQRHSHYRA